MPIRVRAWWSATLLALLTASLGAQEAEHQPTTDAPQAAASEVALPPPPAPGEVPSAEFMAAVTEAATRGGRLYDAGEYALAVPHLAVAAERGFKVPQASLGDILLNGRGGVERDTQAGLGWLGVAAAPTTLPRIERYFGQAMRQLPADYRTTADQIVRAYRDAFGGRVHRVRCQLRGDVVKDLQCSFIDAERDEDSPVSDLVFGDDVEEMVVVAPIISAMAPERGEIPSGTFIAQVYEAVSRGNELYRQKRYKEALPFLLIASERGFKWAQASAADILLHGRGGVPVDLETGIGWLGVAAQPKTDNSILAFFKESVALLPERFTPEAVDEIVSSYRAQYGSLEHRVACRRQPADPAWSLRVKSLRCHFIDEATQCRDVSIEDEEIGWQWTCQPLEGAQTRDARPY